MKKTIYKCDHCGEETKWLYEMPRIEISGLHIVVHVPQFELCKECAERALNCYRDLCWGDSK